MFAIEAMSMGEPMLYLRKDSENLYYS